MPAATPAAPFDLDAAWDIHPQVAVRPERFGALLYHFGTRRLSFLKDRRLLHVVRTLADRSSATEACRAAGIASAELPRFGAALATLAASQMIVLRPAPDHDGTQGKETP
ncbi:mycofactocin biosynthesis chaperone MftB [Streptomyces sp. NPDC046909]|uniref:mycofactocin biosynthesis chaperone MftB n=1 Tax=Streptomyces sp. NPDC046909 TaxID=3155617 RepID=UPI0033C27753